MTSSHRSLARLSASSRASRPRLQTARETVSGALRAGEADLGGGLFKRRLARPGGGKRGGYRMIVAYHPPNIERVLFTYAFVKNAAATLTPRGHEALAKVAAAFMAADDEQVAKLLVSGEVSEVACDGDDKV